MMKILKMANNMNQLPIAKEFGMSRRGISETLPNLKALDVLWINQTMVAFDSWSIE